MQENGVGTGANGRLEAIAVQPTDGKVLIGGWFTAYNGTACNRIARLNTNGTLDIAFDSGAGPDGPVFSLALQSDGKVLIGGNFTSYNGTARNGIARLNTDGSLDNSFNPGTGVNGTIRAFALQSDGKVVIGGNFTSYNGMARNRIARLETNGNLDGGFNPTGPNGPVLAIAYQPSNQPSNDRLLIGGNFSTYSGADRNNVARLLPDGTLDLSFTTGIIPGSGGANSTVRTLALQPDGTLLIGGNFTSYNGTARNRIARLLDNGLLDGSFNPGAGANNTVWTLALQPGGKVLIGGDFTTYNSTARNGLARLNSNGMLDTDLDPGAGAIGVQLLATQPGGRVLIGGILMLTTVPRATVSPV